MITFVNGKRQTEDEHPPAPAGRGRCRERGLRCMMREEEAPATQWGADPSLNDVEALMWKAEASPKLRSAGVFVDLLDREPDWDRLVAAHEWATELVPRLRQRVADDPLRIGPPTWVLDDGFDLG